MFAEKQREKIMVISTIELPKNQNPEERELDDEDKNILAAFKIVFDGYRRAQGRTRAIIKAYNDLESIALNLLKERQENRDSSPKQPHNESSAPIIDVDNELADVFMVDLTSDFDFEGAEPIVKPEQSPTPIFGVPTKANTKKRSFEDRNFAKAGESSLSTKLEIVKNQYGIKIGNKSMEGNEENSALVGNTSVADTSDVESRLHVNESKPSAKISLSKASYKIEKHKAPSGKASKQSTLSFQPLAAKMDISCSEKMKSNSASRHWANLFDEDYRVNKNSNGKESVAVDDKNYQQKIVAKEKEKCLQPLVRSVSKVFGEKSTIQKEQNAQDKIDKNIVMETPSDINETARSLFEDEDLEDFEISQDLMNTCMDAPMTVDLATAKSPEDFGKRRKIDVPIASTSKVGQSFRAHDSIDETFFAPGEPQATKNTVAKPVLRTSQTAGCSTVLMPKKARDTGQVLKRKTVDDEVEKNNEIEDLDLVNVDWGTDDSNDDWSPAKRPMNNSYDIVPVKTKKSPEYAYKTKAERNKNKRNKLPGWDCWECEKYYATLNLPPAELKKRMDACSRHKFKYNPRYNTPKDFWNPEFPDTLDSSDWSDNERPVNKD